MLKHPIEAEDIITDEEDLAYYDNEQKQLFDAIYAVSNEALDYIEKNNVYESMADALITYPLNTYNIEDPILKFDIQSAARHAILYERRTNIIYENWGVNPRKGMQLEDLKLARQTYTYQDAECEWLKEELQATIKNFIQDIFFYNAFTNQDLQILRSIANHSINKYDDLSRYVTVDDEDEEAAMEKLFESLHSKSKAYRKVLDLETRYNMDGTLNKYRETTPEIDENYALMTGNIIDFFRRGKKSIKRKSDDAEYEREREALERKLTGVSIGDDD